MTSTGRKGFTGYLGFVLVPVVIAVSLGSWQWFQHSEAVSFDRYQRTVDSAAVLLVMAVDKIQRELAARAPIVDVRPPYSSVVRAAIEAALAGDTIAGLATTDTSLELTVVIADTTGIVRMIREPFHPLFLEVLPGVTKLGVSLYLRGQRSATTDPPLGPVELDTSTVRRLTTTETGVRYSEDGVLGIFKSVRTRPSMVPELVLLVGEEGTGSRSRGLLTLLPILGIVLFLALTAAWTMIRSVEKNSEQPTSFTQSVLLVLIPLLAGAVILFAFDREFRTQLVEVGSRELSESVLMVRQLDLLLSPDLIKQVMGFEVAIVGPNGIDATTLVDVELVGAISRLKLPPPNFMSSGVTHTSLGPALYEMVRVGSNRGVVLVRTDQPGRIASLRASLLRISLIMLTPALLFLTVGGMGAGRSGGTKFPWWSNLTP